MPTDIRTIDPNNPEQDKSIKTNLPNDPANWSEIEFEGIKHDHEGLSILRDWVRENFQRTDKGNLGEKFNSLNAVPLWDTPVQPVGNSIILSKGKRYGQLLFYVSSYPTEEHWAVFVDYSGDLSDSDVFTPRCHYCAINLVDKKREFEDYYDINIMYYQRGLSDTQKRVFQVDITPTRKTRYGGVQYRSITSIHNIWNDKEETQDDFAKTWAIYYQTPPYYARQKATGITICLNEGGGSSGETCVCGEVKRKYFYVENFEAKVGEWSGYYGTDPNFSGLIQRKTILEGRIIEAQGINLNDIVGFSVMMKFGRKTDNSNGHQENIGNIWMNITQGASEYNALPDEFGTEGFSKQNLYGDWRGREAKQMTDQIYLTGNRHEGGTFADENYDGRILDEIDYNPDNQFPMFNAWLETAGSGNTEENPNYVPEGEGRRGIVANLRGKGFYTFRIIIDYIPGVEDREQSN